MKIVPQIDKEDGSSLISLYLLNQDELSEDAYIDCIYVCMELLKI